MSGLQETFNVANVVLQLHVICMFSQEAEGEFNCIKVTTGQYHLKLFTLLKGD